MQCPMNAKRGVAIFLLCVVGGCGDRGRSNEAQEASPLKPIAKFYGDYFNQHQGRAPSGEAEFKAFLLEPKNAESLKSEFQITDIDKLLISPRDNQPYVIYYGAMSKTTGPGGAPIVAYEKEGLDGKRFVASALGAVEECDEASFRKMVPDAAK
jgi:hypothetical protein